MTWQEELARSFENVSIDNVKQQQIEQLLVTIENRFKEYKERFSLTEGDFVEFVKQYQEKIDEIFIKGGGSYGIDLSSFCQARYSELLTVRNIYNAQMIKTVGEFLKENEEKFESYKKQTPFISQMLSRFAANKINFGTYDGHTGGSYNPINDTLTLKFDRPELSSFLTSNHNSDAERISTIVHELEHKVDHKHESLSAIINHFSGLLLQDLSDRNLEEYRKAVLKLAEDIDKFFGNKINVYIKRLELKIAKLEDASSIKECFAHDFVYEIIPNLIGFYHNQELQEIELLMKNDVSISGVSSILEAINNAFGSENNRTRSNFYTVQNGISKKGKDDAKKGLNQNLLKIISGIESLGEEIQILTSYAEKIEEFFSSYREEFKRVAQLQGVHSFDVVLYHFQPIMPYICFIFLVKINSS